MTNQKAYLLYLYGDTEKYFYINTIIQLANFPIQPEITNKLKVTPFAITCIKHRPMLMYTSLNYYSHKVNH